MEPQFHSQLPTFLQTTWFHTTEDSNLHSHCHENLKSDILQHSESTFCQWYKVSTFLWLDCTKAPKYR